ncbi:MAG: LuxR C-terminal-related transcriptional regulator [Ilumatobacteraceae bacterium]
MNERSTSTLAATKLRAPTPPPRLIDRSRLATVLRDANAADLPLVLVSAPAGSGKSTLVAGWADEYRGSVAWLQLEESDSDPARFWVSVTAAIGALHAEVADHLGPVLAGSFGVGEVVVPALVNEVESLPGRLIVVLDDYHLIDAVEVHRGVERFIDLCPPNLTIVLITRADPPFRLGRMRVRGRVREIRGSDLRFDSAEAAALLGSAAAGLTPQRLDDLCARTEGWAAGLVLAGLSLDRVDDADRFVDTFGGDDQLIVGYLTDEMLARLDPDERTRIVEAAVLHRLSGPLLDAVTGSDDGARWLDALASRNQLVIRLDTVGEWYRYHHLLRDMLLLEARRSIPDRLPDLHRRAAAWFETSDHPAAAVDHRLAAGDREQAMRLMRVVGPDLLGSGELRILRNILGRLSAGGELDATCLALSGWDHYLTGRYDRARQLLDSALASLPADVDPMRLMPLRINIALGTGDVGEALSVARDVVANGDLEAQPSELITAAMAAFVWAGLSDEALAILPTALARTRAEHRTTAHGMSLVAAAVVEFHRADPATALAAAQRALDFAGSSGLGAYHGIAPALAIRAAVTPGASAQSDAEQAVTLARRATTRLGLVVVLTLAGDVMLRDDGAMLRAGGEDGRALIDEAHRIIETCADPGIALPILERVAARHRVVRTRAVPTNGLVEQLSERELAVLRYLPSTLSLPEIARELFVSPNTVKTQCSAIYRKLQVTSRRSAVQAARERRIL